MKGDIFYIKQNIETTRPVQAGLVRILRFRLSPISTPLASRLDGLCAS